MSEKLIVSREKLDSLAEVIASKSEHDVPLTFEGMEDAVLSIETGIEPIGIISITKNGIHDVTEYANAKVNVQPKLESASVIPSESEQVIIANYGYDGLSDVTVGAIPSEYIVPTGTLYVNHNLITDVSSYQYVSVSGITKKQEKTVTPSASRQVVRPDEGVYLLNYEITNDPILPYTIEFDSTSIADYDSIYITGTAVFGKNGSVIHRNNFSSDSDFYWDPSLEKKRTVTYNWANGGLSLVIDVFDGFLQVNLIGDSTASLNGTTIQFIHRPYTALRQVIVEPIPSNYGLITWDGNVLTVS